MCLVLDRTAREGAVLPSPPPDADRLRADLTHSYQPPEYTGELAQIAQAFRRLPGAEREVLALSAWEGLDPGQIAIVLDCSRNAVRVRLHRARKRLARELANSHAHPPAPRTRVPNGDLA
jgi:RNA polymerase sigma-70 factor, ECF subfamily